MGTARTPVLSMFETLMCCHLWDMWYKPCGCRLGNILNLQLVNQQVNFMLIPPHSQSVPF